MRLKDDDDDDDGDDDDDDDDDLTDCLEDAGRWWDKSKSAVAESDGQSADWLSSKYFMKSTRRHGSGEETLAVDSPLSACIKRLSFESSSSVEQALFPVFSTTTETW